MNRAELAGLRAWSYVAGLLPERSGQWRIAETYWHRRRPPHRLLEQRLVRGPRVTLDIGDRTQAMAYLTRRYSPDLVGEIVARLPAGGLFVDVGANVGLISAQVAHKRPDARIVAFEANPKAGDLFERNAPGALLIPTAVTDHNGTVRFDAPDTDLGWGQISDNGRLTVPAVTLDAYTAAHNIDRVDVLKIDVEGSEPDVLTGARGLLERQAIRAVIVELNDENLAARGSSRTDVLATLNGYGLTGAGEGSDAVLDLDHSSVASSLRS